MTNLWKTIKGISMFIAGYAYVYISYYIVPAIINEMPTTITDMSTNLTGVIWLVIFISWIFALVFLSPLFIYNSIVEQTDDNKASAMAQGVLYLIFAIILTVVGYWWIPELANMYTETLLQGLVYVGAFITWTLGFIGAPVMKIIKAKET